MQIRFAHIDAFSAQPYAGNPAAVCCLPHGHSIDDATLQLVAAEFNLSETAFVSPLHHDGDNRCADFSLRWMTPTKEVKLCGHATLATAHALRTVFGAEAEQLRFHTLSGVLVVSPNAAGPGLCMQFPAYIPRPVPEWRQGAGARSALLRALLDRVLQGQKESAGAVEDLLYAPETGKLYVVLQGSDCPAVLRSLQPDVPGLFAVDQSCLPPQERVTGVCVTCALSQMDAVFASRYFSPWNGIPEDPVNGSSHTSLGPLWAMRWGLWPQGDRACSLTGMAYSARGGTLTVTLVPSAQDSEGKAALSHVLIGGEACTVAAGSLTLHGAAS